MVGFLLVIFNFALASRVDDSHSLVKIIDLINSSRPRNSLVEKSFLFNLPTPEGKICEEPYYFICGQKNLDLEIDAYDVPLNSKDGKKNVLQQAFNWSDINEDYFKRIEEILAASGFKSREDYFSTMAQKHPMLSRIEVWRDISFSMYALNAFSKEFSLSNIKHIRDISNAVRVAIKRIASILLVGADRRKSLELLDHLDFKIPPLFDDLQFSKSHLSDNYVLKKPLQPVEEWIWDASMPERQKMLEAHYLPVNHSKNSPTIQLSTFWHKLSAYLPEAYIGVIAHEYAHHLGPRVSLANKYSLSPKVAELLACFKGKDSVQMIDSQSDEVIADYFSGSLLVHAAKDYSLYQRTELIRKALRRICIAGKSDYQGSGTHLKPQYRIEGVLFANPELRNFLNCTDSPKRFKVCE